MIGYWLKRFDIALQEEIKELEDSCRRWKHALGGNDTDRVVIKTLQHISRALRRVIEEGA
jgi:hypothetical protein